MSRSDDFARPDVLATLCRIARGAGEVIMRHYRTDYKTDTKADNSPVTIADHLAHHHIAAALAALAPDIPVISEEGVIPASVAGPLYWLVDPLDGTRSFVRGSGEFTVNIALVEEGEPRAGVIYLPLHEKTYAAHVAAAPFMLDAANRRQEFTSRRLPPEGLSVILSHHHESRGIEAFLADKQVQSRQAVSSSIKFCLVADGTADLYPRFGPTMEWDTAAGHAILLAAGGQVETLDGEPLRYGKPGFANPHFLAWGKRL